MQDFAEYTRNADYSVVMDDDSMNPVFFKNDELFVRVCPVSAKTNGKIAVGRYDTLIIGNVYVMDDGLVCLVPENSSSYRPRIIVPEDVIGLVVGYTRHLEWDEDNSGAHEALPLEA